MELSTVERILVARHIEGKTPSYKYMDDRYRYHVILHYNGYRAVECYVVEDNTNNTSIAPTVSIVKHFEEPIGDDPIGSLEAIGNMYNVVAIINLADTRNQSMN